jgi:hypothetical protein
MAYMMEIIFITRNNTGADKLGQSFTPKMSETTMPKRGGCGDERGGAGGGWLERIEVARAIAPGDHVPGLQILHKRPKGSNSIEQLLSMVKRRMEIKFLMMWGDTKTSLRTRLRYRKESVCDPMVVTGRCAPFPTMIDEGV